MDIRNGNRSCGSCHGPGVVRPILLRDGPLDASQFFRRFLAFGLGVVHTALFKFEAVATPDYCCLRS